MNSSMCIFLLACSALILLAATAQSAPLEKEQEQLLMSLLNRGNAKNTSSECRECKRNVALLADMLQQNAEKIFVFFMTLCPNLGPYRNECATLAQGMLPLFEHASQWLSDGQMVCEQFGVCQPVNGTFSMLFDQKLSGFINLAKNFVAKKLFGGGNQCQSCQSMITYADQTVNAFGPQMNEFIRQMACPASQKSQCLDIVNPKIKIFWKQLHVAVADLKTVCNEAGPC